MLKWCVGLELRNHFVCAYLNGNCSRVLIDLEHIKCERKKQIRLSIKDNLEL